MTSVFAKQLAEISLLEFQRNDLLDEIQCLQSRVQELEAEQKWIHEDTKMIVCKDGNRWCFVLPDFIDLQVSESVWMDGIISSYLDKVYNRLLQPPKDGE